MMHGADPYGISCRLVVGLAPPAASEVLLGEFEGSELAELFDQSMAAGSALFGPVLAHPALTAADVPASSDVHLLYRVLHDWDDERCREVLRHCACALPDHADLLVIERVLPADGSVSLPTAWDLHRMCNVRGRERRATHDGRLVADASSW
ncbi:methyltransferase [Streptomyces sp. NPDC005195]|uniref:methyltransferase n=1 Tax=Streptomyces sp. NPDC005195 TaxID=3154561 RepID=UPI0033A71287